MLGCERIDFGELAEPAHPQDDDDERADAADHHGRHRPEPRRGDARLEFAELIRRADEHRVDRGHAAAHRVGRAQLHQR
jgi:hypothetical protein